MKNKIIAAVAGLVSIAPLYLLILCIVSLIEWGITRNLAPLVMPPCVLCIIGLWAIMIDGFRNKLCRRTWWIFGACLILTALYCLWFYWELYGIV